MKLGLLRMSLDFRLRELPWDHGNGTRLDALRNELLVGAGSISPMYLRSRANSTGTMAKCNQYLTVAKPAALTGTLQIRFVASLLGSVAEWCWHDFRRRTQIFLLTYLLTYLPHTHFFTCSSIPRQFSFPVYHIRIYVEKISVTSA